MKESGDLHTQEVKQASPEAIRALQHRQYNPYTPEQWAKIKSDWESYKQDVGLEVEIYLQLTREGKSNGDALKLVEEYRKEVEKTREVWYDLRR
jgi:hypothetical protein